MKRTVVTESAIRKLVSEILWNQEFAGWSSDNEGPVLVNPNVDPSAAATDPVNPNFEPMNKVELGVAVDQMVKDMPDSDVPEFYDAFQATLEDERRKKEKEEMHTKADQGGSEQVEAVVRQAIRDILKEAGPEPQRPHRWNRPFVQRRKQVTPGPVVGPLPPVTKVPAGVHGGEYLQRIEKNKDDLRRGMGKAIQQYENPATDDDEALADEPQARRTYKNTALGAMTDVQGATFEEIAKELGFSVAGAKQAVDKALDKARWITQFSGTSAEGEESEGDDLEIMVLSAMNDYIRYLNRSGELTPADIQLMKSHPDIVRDLDGFREFLHNYIRRARRADQEVDTFGERPSPSGTVDDDDEAEVAAELGGEAPPAPRPAPERAARPAGSAKAAYKVYPGGRRYGGKPVVTRFKGKVYGPAGETQFKPGEQGEVFVDGENLRFKKSDSDHTQTWEPVPEGKRPVLYLKPLRGNR